MNTKEIYVANIIIILDVQYKNHQYFLIIFQSNSEAIVEAL